MEPEKEPSSRKFPWFLFLLGLFVVNLFNSNPKSSQTQAIPAQRTTDSPNSRATAVAPLPPRSQRKRWYKRFRTYVFLINVLTLAAVAWYASITHDMWKEMQRQTKTAQEQTKTAQEQLEQSQRPWIKIIDVQPQGNFPIVGGLSFQKIGPYKEFPDIRVQASLQIDLSFTNIGHSVADVTPNLELTMPQFSTSEYWTRISTEEQRFCGSPSITAVTTQKLVVFPNEAQPTVWHAGISMPIRPENINHLSIGTGITPALIVCVSYRHQGLPNLYQTRAVYEISHKGTGDRFFDFGTCNLTPFSNAVFTFCEGGTPAKLLKLDRDNNGDDAY